MDTLEESSVCSALCHFITEVQKLDGSDFPPKTLHEIIICIQMLLETYGLYWKLLDDPKFLDLKFTLDNIMKICTKEGLCKPVQQADIIILEQEDILWQSGILGKDKPEQLLNTLIYVLDVNLALRAGKEHHSLQSIGRNSQLKFVMIDGERAVQYREDITTKTNQGGLHHRKIHTKTVTIYPSFNHV